MFDVADRPEVLSAVISRLREENRILGVDWHPSWEAEFQRQESAADPLITPFSQE